MGWKTFNDRLALVLMGLVGRTDEDLLTCPSKTSPVVMLDWNPGKGGKRGFFWCL